MRDRVTAIFDQNSNSCRLMLADPFTETSRVAFHQAIENQDARVGTWIVDFTKVRFIDSSGLGLLVLLKEKADGKDQAVVLLNPTVQVLESLRVANFHRLFDISYSASA